MNRSRGSRRRANGMVTGVSGVQPVFSHNHQAPLCYSIDNRSTQLPKSVNFSSLAFLPDGRLIAVDSTNKRVNIFEPRGGICKNITCEELETPWGVATTEDGAIAVTDTENRSVKIYSSDGDLQNQFRCEGLREPSCISVQRHLDNIIVSDFMSPTLCVYSFDGKLCNRCNLKSLDENAEVVADGLAAGSQNAYACCGSGSKIQVIDIVRGTLVCQFGDFEWPSGLCMDQQENIIVCDKQKGTVSLHSQDGVKQRNLLSHKDIQKYPVSVAVSQTGLLAVTLSDDLYGFANEIKTFRIA